jgi:hypothetical protein
MSWDVVMEHTEEEHTLEVNEGQPTISTRCLAAWKSTSYASVHHTLQEQQLYPYLMLSEQELITPDAPARCAFCQWTSQYLTEDPILAASSFQWDHHIRSEHVSERKSSCNSVLPSARGYHQSVEWNFRRLLHHKPHNLPT